MKSVIFFSNDYNISYSFLMYLQNMYNVTITTDLNIIKSIVSNTCIDLIIMDTEPTSEIAKFCREIKEIKNGLPVIITYVYKDNIKESEIKLKKYVNSIFYKPYDINEVSRTISDLMLAIRT